MKTIYVNDLEIYDEQGQVDIKKLNQWLATNQEDSVELIFEKGEYFFDALAHETSYFVLHNIKNLIFNGQGSVFNFSQVGNYFRISECENVVLKNLYLDWNWDREPLASVGFVEEVGEDGSYIEVNFPRKKHVDEQMRIEMVGPLHPQTLAPGTDNGVEFRPFINPHIPETIRQSDDAALKNMIRELEQRFSSFHVVGKGRLRFIMKDPIWTKQWMKKGQAYNFRHFEYDTIGVLVENSRHIYFDHVTMYSCPGSGFVIRNDVQSFGFDHCQIILRPGTDRSITTTADGIHIANTQGKFFIRYCQLSRSGDDCINFHDNTLSGFKRSGTKQITFSNFSMERTPIYLGDRLEFRHQDLSPTKHKRTVVDMEYCPEKNTATIEFDEPLADEIHEKMMVWNTRYHTGDFHIHHNHFFENRARAILVHGSNGTIEHNRFDWIQGAAIQVETGAEVRWAEGCGVKNVSIRHNHFQSCNINGWSMATIYIGVYLPQGRTSYPIFENISIENNTFIYSPRQAVFISSAKSIKVSSNSIRNYMYRDLHENTYGSSQQEVPMYGEEYHGMIQQIKSKHVEISHLF